MFRLGSASAWSEAMPNQYPLVTSLAWPMLRTGSCCSACAVYGSQIAQASACRWVNARQRVGGLQEHQLDVGRGQPGLVRAAEHVPVRRAALADRDATCLADRRSSVIGESACTRIWSPDSAAVVRGHHLDLGVGRGTEDRRRVAGDGEVDLARGGGLDLRRAGGEGGELHLVGQVVELPGGPQQRLGAALLVTDLQGQSGQVGQRHGRRGFRAPRGRSAATRSRSAATGAQQDASADGQRTAGTQT